MRLKTLRVACVAVLVVASACSPQPTSAPQSAAAPSVLDRTVLPIHEPAAPTYRELDAQNAKAPPLFAVKAPDGVARFGMLYTPSWNKVASEQVVTPEILKHVQNGVRSREFFRNGLDGPVFVTRLNDDTMISNSHQWDAVWPDGDIWKAGLMCQAIYVYPKRDLVIAFFSVNGPDDSIHRYLRPIATSLRRRAHRLCRRGVGLVLPRGARMLRAAFLANL